MIHQALSIAEVQRLERSASRSTSPCGETVTMTWRRWGEGPPVVLLHGGSGSWTHWIRNIDFLSREHSVWVADMPGCGDSDLPAGAYDADSIHQHIVRGIEQCGEGRPVDLIGFSFGSLVSGLIAADYPHLVRRLVLIAPPALGIHEGKLNLRSLGREMPAEEYERTVRHNLKALMLHSDAAIDDLAVALHAYNFDRDRLRMRRLARSRIMQTLQARWQCPVYAIWGREDVLVHHAPERLADALGGCDLRALEIIDDAGHWAQYEQPDAVHRALASFLRT